MEQMTLLEMPKGKKNPTSGCKGAIAQTAIKVLEETRSAKLALEAVQKAFPNAKTSIKCIYWYASKMKIELQKSARNVELEQAAALGRVA